MQKDVYMLLFSSPSREQRGRAGGGEHPSVLMQSPSSVTCNQPSRAVRLILD